MSEESITYARGRVVELQEEIEILKSQMQPVKKTICSLSCSEDTLDVKQIKALLDDYEVKSNKLSDTFKKLNTIKEKWGI